MIGEFDFHTSTRYALDPDHMCRGGMVVWRCAGWYPELVSHLFAICTPYAAPTKKYTSTEDMVNGPVPQFGYQLHLASGEVEPRIADEKNVRQFLNGMYGGRGPKGEVMFSPNKGILFENLPKVGKTKLMSDRVRTHAWVTSIELLNFRILTPRKRKWTGMSKSTLVMEYMAPVSCAPVISGSEVTDSGCSELVSHAKGELGGRVAVRFECRLWPFEVTF